MDIFASMILATSVTCPNNKELFEVSCTISDGFDVRINESCRRAYFPFIDFTNSFVWGDPSKVQMENPTGSTGIDVDQFGVCKSIIRQRNFEPTKDCFCTDTFL